MAGAEDLRQRLAGPVKVITPCQEIDGFLQAALGQSGVYMHLEVVFKLLLRLGMGCRARLDFASLKGRFAHGLDQALYQPGF